MGIDAIVMMVSVMAIIWGGFIISIVMAFKQEKKAREEEIEGNREA